MGRTPAVVAAVLLVAVGSGGAASAQPKTVRIQADNFRFCDIGAVACTPTDSDHVTTVKVGTRVKWIYKDTACDAIAPCPGHNVVLRHGGTTRFTKSDGKTIFSMVFKRAGTYSYVCSAHQSFGMTGRIVVKR
jgi:plastocyanin